MPELTGRILGQKLLERLTLSNDGIWRDTFELPRDGALLVRPDGHVGWRSQALRGPHHALTTAPWWGLTEERLATMRRMFDVCTSRAPADVAPASRL